MVTEARRDFMEMDAEYGGIVKQYLKKEADLKALEAKLNRAA